jgi:dihydroorotase
MKDAFDLVIKGGTVVDPSQGIHEQKDVAIAQGRIADVRRGLNASAAKRVVDASGKLVTPGLIDLHVHCSHGINYIAVDPETACLRKGCTTVVDAGSMGELNFMGFRKYVMDASKARILALLNIESLGMVEFARDNQKWPQLITGQDSMFINVEGTCEVANQNKDVVVGLKWAHHGVEGLALARKAADEVGCLVMAENHHQPDCLKYLKRGDLITHLYHGLRMEQHDGLLDADGRVQPEFFEAQKRGVVFDLGHGAGSFTWEVAEKGLSQGIKPDTLGTDLHTQNLNGPVFDLPTTMSKLLMLRMTLDEVVEASTFAPAKVLGKQKQIGTLKVGSCADVAIIRLQKGKFVFKDVKGEERMGRLKLAVTGVVKDGEVIV